MNRFDAMRSQETPAEPHRSDPNRRRFLTLLTAGLTWIIHHATATANDWITLRQGRRRVAPLCSLPPADYEHRARTPSVFVRSQFSISSLSTEDLEQATSAIRRNGESIALLRSRLQQDTTLSADQFLRYSDELLQREWEGNQWIQEATEPRAKFLQIASQDLTIGHGRISDLAILIDRNGRWRVSLRAEQNFLPDGNAEGRNVDLQLKRNAFHVTIRMLHSSRASGENLTPKVGFEHRTAQSSKLVLAEISIPEFWVQREAPRTIVQNGSDPQLAADFAQIDQAEVEFFVVLDPLTGGGRGVVQPWQREP